MCLGDVNAIEIGQNSSLQDRVVVHTSSVSEGKFAEPTKIGNNVTVGRDLSLGHETRLSFEGDL